MTSWACSFVFSADDRADAVEARILAALEAEGIDFDPFLLAVERVADDEEHDYR